MLQRSNSRLAPRGRQRLVELVRAGESVSAVAREAGVSRQTAHKWIARAEAGELLSDRPSRPSRLARLTPPTWRRGSWRPAAPVCSPITVRVVLLHLEVDHPVTDI